MEWISVKDRLPANEEPALLAQAGFPHIHAGYLDEEEGWIVDAEPAPIRVTHWMPLPESPEPPKPPIQEVCEWLQLALEAGCSEDWQSVQARIDSGRSTQWLRSLFWRIETVLISRSYNGPRWDQWKGASRVSLYVDTMLNGIRCDGDTRGNALIKAAMWLKEQEECDE